MVDHPILAMEVADHPILTNEKAWATNNDQLGGGLPPRWAGVASLDRPLQLKLVFYSRLT